jgi:hypothetical protein
LGVVGDAVKTAAKQYQPAAVKGPAVAEVNVRTSFEVVLGVLVVTAPPEAQGDAKDVGPQIVKASVPVGAGEPAFPTTVATS